ncbi:MAG: hypothetical protein KDA41_15810, partial [Planctomycetales bacterium]|nr:hypothetical protein [Planctomycetales bacterium]
GQLSDGQIAATKREVFKGRMSDERLFTVLREELLAMKLIDAMRRSFQTTTPSEAWLAHSRMKRPMTAEFVPMRVEDFVAKVTGEPTESEIEALYDKNKERLAGPNDKEPGFYRRTKIDFHYIQANIDDFLTAAKAEVTAEQIARYYEENKNTFRVEEPAFSPVESNDSNSTDPRNTEPSPPAPSDDAAPATEPAATEPAATEPDTSEPAKPTDEPAAPATDPAAPAEEPKPDTSEPAADAPAVSDESTGGNGADEVAAEAEAPAESEPTADTAATPDEPAPPAEPATTEPAATEPAVTEPAPSTDDSPVLPPKPSTGGDDDLTAPPSDKPAAGPKFKPLSEVEDQIRAALARPIAQQRMDQARAEAKQELLDYQFERQDYLEEHGEDAEPPKFDGQAVAKRLGLTYHETGLIDAPTLYDSEEFEVGKSYERPRSLQEGRNNPFLGRGFREGVLLYQEIETEIAGDKYFLTWKAAEEPAHTPALADVRDEVVKAWRFQKARALAEQAAKDLAAKVDGKKPLADQVNKETEVLTPPSFTYFDTYSVIFLQMGQGDLQFGTIPEIEGSDSDAIKRAVMNMTSNSVEVVHDEGEKVYYVVRKLGEGSPTGKSRDEFMQDIVDNPREDGAPPHWQYAGQVDKIRYFRDWVGRLAEEYDVQWQEAAKDVN